jgi:hypothetical protein
VQLLRYLKGDYLCQTIGVPRAQENSEQNFFLQPKAHQNKFANLNKTVPTNPLRMIAFFEQCQATNKAADVLEKIAKTRSRPRKGKRLIFLPRIAANQATVIITVTGITITIKATNAIATIANLTIIIETIDATIVVDVTIRSQGAPSPMTRKIMQG